MTNPQPPACREPIDAIVGRMNKNNEKHAGNHSTTIDETVLFDVKSMSEPTAENAAGLPTVYTIVVRSPLRTKMAIRRYANQREGWSITPVEADGLGEPVGMIPDGGPLDVIIRRHFADAGIDVSVLDGR